MPPSLLVNPGLMSGSTISSFVSDNQLSFVEDIRLPRLQYQNINISLTVLREVVKKNGLFTVRLTVRVDPPLPPPYGQGVVIFSK